MAHSKVGKVKVRANFHWPEEGNYLALHVAARSTEKVIYDYCEKNEEEGRAFCVEGVTEGRHDCCEMSAKEGRSGLF